MIMIRVWWCRRRCSSILITTTTAAVLMIRVICTTTTTTRLRLRWRCSIVSYTTAIPMGWMCMWMWMSMWRRVCVRMCMRMSMRVLLLLLLLYVYMYMLLVLLLRMLLMLLWIVCMRVHMRRLMRMILCLRRGRRVHNSCPTTTSSRSSNCSVIMTLRRCHGIHTIGYRRHLRLIAILKTAFLESNLGLKRIGVCQLGQQRLALTIKLFTIQCTNGGLRILRFTIAYKRDATFT
mmetsp:Transcript_49569/g.82535  ORF Transcript_49569/g.82535 Transcript_49569/m.82535 type:complete len:234 (+) Transcript_49569:1083-1784(+)